MPYRPVANIIALGSSVLDHDKVSVILDQEAGYSAALHVYVEHRDLADAVLNRQLFTITCPGEPGGVALTQMETMQAGGITL